MKLLNKNKKTKIFFGALLFFAITISGCGTPEMATKPILKIDPIIIEHGPRDKKNIALTFDADMTASMQKKLQKKEIKTLYE